jgi:hypothetical protein
VEDNFGVAVCAKNVTLRFQFRPELEEIIELPVKDDAARSVLVPNGLLSA